jgi:hypothetical protein
MSDLLVWVVSKSWYRSVSGLTGTGSTRWSGSQVVHRLEPTESPVWTGYPGRNELPGSHCWLSFLTSRTIVHCRIKDLSTEQFWNSDTNTINLRVGYSWSRRSQWSVRCGFCRCIFYNRTDSDRMHRWNTHTDVCDTLTLEFMFNWMCVRWVGW